jgi:hypothetical protein
VRWAGISHEIDESPRAIPQPASTSFDDENYNKMFAARILARKSETIEQNPNFQIIRTGDGNRGWIMLYNEQQKSADYVVQYATRRWPFLNTRTITQVIIWRDLYSPYARGLTRRMFFDHLLSRYGAVMSDLAQTPQGNEFWRARMADAATLGLRVGIVQLNQKTVDWFDPAAGQTVRRWLGSARRTYDTAQQFDAIRYLIMKA